MSGRAVALRLAPALLLGVLAGCAHGPKAGPGAGETVEAEGWAPLDGADRLSARQRALADAQKKAVEKVTGVTVAARTKVESAITLEQKIEADVAGCIRRYDVLSEREQDGFMKVRIRAFVLREPPAADARAIKVAVAAEDPELARALRSSLAAQGFTLLEKPEAADVVVTASARATPQQDVRLGAFHAFRARVALDAAAKTGEALSETREASGLDASVALAREKAVEAAADAAGQALGAGLRRRAASR